MLVLDLVVFHRRPREPSLRQSAFWTLFWVLVALAFNALIWWWGGSESAIYFLTGYLVEWSLSMDNVFVFAVIFGYFHVPLKHQYRVLFWGIWARSSCDWLSCWPAQRSFAASSGFWLCSAHC